MKKKEMDESWTFANHAVNDTYIVRTISATIKIVNNLSSTNNFHFLPIYHLFYRFAPEIAIILSSPPTLSCS